MRHHIYMSVAVMFFSTASCRTPASSDLNNAGPNAPAALAGCASGDIYCRDLDETRFNKLAADVAVGGENQKVVKFVLDRRNRQKPVLYFFNTSKFAYHHDFVTNGLGVNIPLNTFNNNYAGDGQARDWNMGSLILHTTKAGDGTIKKRMLMEIWNGDELAGDYFKDLYTRIKDGSKQITHPFFYHPLSTSQEQASSDKQFFTVITSSELYADREFIVLNQGEAVGYVTIIDSQAAGSVCLDHTKIAVFQKVPNDLGLVAGVITQEFQTPLSHVNVKSVNRGTVNMSLRDAIQKMKQYEGQPVRLRLVENNYEITPLDRNTADTVIADFWQQRRPRVLENPTATLGSSYGKAFVNLEAYFKKSGNTRKGKYVDGSVPNLNAHKSLVRIIGAKATNMGVLKLLESTSASFKETQTKIVPALGIPFDFYEAFMKLKQPGLDPSDPAASFTPEEVIRSILNEGKLLQGDLHSVCDAKPYLDRIRKVYEKATVPPALIKQFREHIYGSDDGTGKVGANIYNSPIHVSNAVPRIRLRSSTNSEDLEGFTGAGLYNSDGVNIFEKRDAGGYNNVPKSWKKIEKDLVETTRFVYSSVWNDRAFEEREWFGINGEKHFQVKVGVLMHRGYPAKGFDGKPGELANGVAISQDVFDDTRSYHTFINGQHFDLAVTNPPTVEELTEHNLGTDHDYRTEEILVTNTLADPKEDALKKAWHKCSYSINQRSSVIPNQQVLVDDPKVTNKLSQMEVRRLARAVKITSDAFADFLGKRPDQFVIDTEWKVDGPARDLFLKQARPYEKRKDIAPQQAGLVVKMRAPVTLGPKFPPSQR